MAASVTLDQLLLQSLEDLQRHGDGQNRVEELVEVPNTEFVALIVGRNGHKIKSIRERTETFIKTPMRTEFPIFKIAGTQNNVARAKREITDIVQRLKSPHYRMGVLGDESAGPRVTAGVRVPFKFVGLVVGFQGTTVMEIQSKTKTHIQTPAHGGDPVFQVTGQPKNVWIAKIMIQFYVEYRTGLRVLDVETLMNKTIEEPILKMLSSRGVSYTLTAVMAKLDDLVNDENVTRLLKAPGTVFHTSFAHPDPIEDLAMQLEGVTMDYNPHMEVFHDLRPHQMGQQQQTIPSHGYQMLPPPQVMVLSQQPPVEHYFYPNQQDAAAFAQNNQLRAIRCQSYAMNNEQPIFEQSADNGGGGGGYPLQLDLSYQAITHQPINALFPDTDPPVNNDGVGVPAYNNNDFWSGPLVQPPQQQHQMLTPPAAAPTAPNPVPAPTPAAATPAAVQLGVSPTHPPPPHPEDNATADSPTFLDESFWDYVANVNDIPPEQVL